MVVGGKEARLTCNAFAAAAQRVLAVRAWRRLPPVVWRTSWSLLLVLRAEGGEFIQLTASEDACKVVFAIYIDSYAFVFASALLQHAFGANSSPRACDGAILLCLACYVTTKVCQLTCCSRSLARGRRSS